VRWPDGPVCSHCGSINHAYAVTGRAGLYRCAEPKCREDFTVTTGTVMERSKIPLQLRSNSLWMGKLRLKIKLRQYSIWLMA
jgi:hypothetical protein